MINIMDFRQPYSRSQYLSFFRNHLLPEDFEAHDEEIHVSFKPLHIQKISKIGEVRSLSLNVYEIEHESENDPRVSISRDSFRFMAQYGVQKALILFISKNSRNFRLSLVTIDLKWEDGKRVEREYSNPRRYSFFLGSDTKTHTPEEYLIKQGRVKDFEDLKKRFSIEVVNKDFYREIAILFTKLTGGQRNIGRERIDAKEGSLKLPSTTSDTLKKEFAVRLIGRLVFCWFLKKKRSDKGISLLPEELLSTESVMKKSGFYHNILEPLFFQVLNTPDEDRGEKYQKPLWSQVPFLNGGLFTDSHHDFYKIDSLGVSMHLNTLIVPDSWLKELFEVFETYNFTIDENTSVDVELSIEPEMLGRIFENLLAEINPETGETARKATGSYYTPRPIVEYMVDESLKQYLKTHLQDVIDTQAGIQSFDNTISKLLSYDDWDIELTGSQKENILNALDRIKIIDPACGSGAFPMGILHKMLLILQKIDPESKNWMSRQLAKIDNKVVRKELENKLKRENWNYVHKLGIIQSSIYGVDIQPIAVEISKLRFFLSLIVDESIDDKKHNRGIIPLPNLEFKFVAANSLIGLPEFKKEEDIGLFEALDEIATLKKLRDEYFTSYGEEKHRLEKEFADTQSRMFKHAVNWQAADSQTMKLSQWNPFSDEASSWFDSEWMFGIKQGFDVVIGNPPYFNINTISKDIYRYLKEQYKTIHTGYNDIVYYFIYQGVEFLNRNGCCAFITSNYFLGNEYARSLRKYLKSHISKVVNFKDHMVFDEASIHTCISFSYKETTSTDVIFFEAVSDEKITTADFERQLRSFSSKRTNLNDDWLMADQSASSIIGKLHQSSSLLGEISIIEKGSTSGKNDIFTISGELAKEKKFEKEPLRKNLKNGDIDKYVIRERGNYLIYIDNDTNIKNYPKIYSYLESYKDVLKKRNEVANGLYPWYRLERPRNKTVFDAKEKIVVPYRAENNRFAYDNAQFFNDGGDIRAIIINNGNVNIKFILSVLNSKLIDWFYGFIGKPKGKVREYFNKPLSLIPIKKISLNDQKPFITLIDQILTAKQKDPQADTSALEKKIDEMVYKLYGLTDDEIAIVEGKG